MNRLLAGACAFAFVLAGCQRHDAAAEKDVATEQVAAPTGWLVADAPGEASIVYRDSGDEPGIALACVQSTKSFRVRAPNPVEGAPIDKETATLVLGDENFIVPVAPGDAGTLVVNAPAVPQLLRALADAKSARLAFRDGFVETGVDTGGAFLGFSKRCETITGVGAAP